MIFIDLMRKRCQLINVDVDVCTVYVSSNCLCDKVRESSFNMTRGGGGDEDI